MTRVIAIAAFLATLAASGAAAQPRVESAPGLASYERPPIAMTAEERELILSGEVPLGSYIAGGVLSYALGFGIGHAVQGRWEETGYLFTLGDAALLGGVVYGAAACNRSDDNCTLLIGSLLGFAAVRVYEVVDAWVAPPLRNRRVREIRDRYRIAPYAVPYRANAPGSSEGGLGLAGGIRLAF